MSDLIDRADAIKAVKMLYITKPRINNDYVYDMAIDNAMDVITLVPSADASLMQDRCKTDASSDLISRQNAIDALKICDSNYDGANCHKCPLRDERWDGAWQDIVTNCHETLMRDSAKLLESCEKAESEAYNRGWNDGIKAVREEIWEDGRDRLD